MFKHNILLLILERGYLLVNILLWSSSEQPQIYELKIQGSVYLLIKEEFLDCNMLKTTDLNYSYEWCMITTWHKYHDYFKNYSNMIDNIERLKTITWEKWTLFISEIYSNHFLTSDLVCPEGLGLGPWEHNLREAPKLINQDESYFHAVFLKIKMNTKICGEKNQNFKQRQDQRLQWAENTAPRPLVRFSYQTTLFQFAQNFRSFHQTELNQFSALK